MSLNLSIARCLVSAVFVTMALFTHFAYTQSAPPGGAPKLTESFTFTLSPNRDSVVSRTIEAMREHDEALRVRDLKAADASVFTRAIDLLRFVPFKLSDSNGNIDDFFTPNYLQADYNRPSSEAHLFNKP